MLFMKFYKSLKLLLFTNKYMFLSFSWIIVQGVQLWQNGIVTGLEAEKYITEANYLLRFGKMSSNNYYLYSTQVFLIAAAIKWKTGFAIIVVVQFLLNIFATIMFYKLAVSFLKRPGVAVLATFFFIINVPYQVYNSFLFTESIFYSLTIIYSSYLLLLKKLTAKNFVFILLFSMLLAITRPTGILFFGAAAFYIFFRFLNHINVLYKILIIASAATLFFVSLNAMLQTGGSLDFMLPFKRENIICGVNTVANVEINSFEKGNSLQGIFYYIYNNHQQFLRLAKLKTFSFFGMLRSYYSFLHNVFLVIFFYPFYVLSLAGIWKKIKQEDRAIIFLILIILLYWLTTLLTCDDWHNRFVLTVSPFLFLLGFAAFSKIAPGVKVKN